MDTKQHQIEVGRDIDFHLDDETTSGIVAHYPHRSPGAGYDYVEVFLGDRGQYDAMVARSHERGEAALLLTIPASDVDYVYDRDEKVADAEALALAEAYADGTLPYPVAPAPVTQPCEACGSLPQFIIGYDCSACGHRQGEPLHSGAFSLGSL